MEVEMTEEETKRVKLQKTLEQRLLRERSGRKGHKNILRTTLPPIIAHQKLLVHQQLAVDDLSKQSMDKVTPECSFSKVHLSI